MNLSLNCVEDAIKSSSSMAEAARKLEMSFTSFKRLAIKYNLYNPNQGKKGCKHNSNRRSKLEEILNGNHQEYQTYKLKNLLLEFGIKKNKCEVCGVEIWQGKQLNCELHHIDGNKFNNSLDNLQMLCPNCHSQTNNYKSKNKIKKNNF